MKGLDNLIHQYILVEETKMSVYETPGNYDNPPYFSTLRKRINERIEKVLRRREKSGRLSVNVLDAGCGTGKQAGVYLDHGLHYCGIDSSAEMLWEASLAHAGRNAYFIQADAVKWLRTGHLGGTYDIVSCCSMLYHIKDPNQFVALLAQKVRGGGTLILEADQPPGILDSIWAFLFRRWEENLDFDMGALNFDYDQGYIVGLLAQNGFDVRVYGINLLTGMIPYPVSTSTFCPSWVRGLYSIIAALDRYVAPFFPRLASNFIIVATRQ